MCILLIQGHNSSYGKVLLSQVCISSQKGGVSR